MQEEMKKKKKMDASTNVALIRKEKFMATLRERQQEVKSAENKESKTIGTVIDEMVIDFQPQFFFDCCAAIFIPRRKLRPVRKAKEGVKADTIKLSKILIHVIKGHNIPVRSASAPTARKIQEYEQANLTRPDIPGGPGMAGRPLNMPGMGQENVPRGLQKFIPPPTITRVESYVEVRYVSSQENEKREEIQVIKVKRTQEIEGVHPDWNEIIEFDIVPRKKEGCFTEEELVGSTDMLYFSLFDEVKNVRNDEEGGLIRKERRFLGSYSLPLLTVFQNPPRLEAMCKINRPVLLFGYYTSVSNLFNSTQEEMSQQSLNPEVPTSISVSVSLDPSISVPAENVADYYPGYEDISFLIFGSRWVKELKAVEVYSKRIMKCFVENFHGMSVFGPRYLIPQKPPEEIINLVREPNSQVAIENAVRYVSLFPFIADTQLLEDLPDMWCTSQEFIDCGSGDYEEHAVLLCNYFNYIDKTQGRDKYESYVIMGKAIPEGFSCYVMRRNKENNHVEIWNAVKGEAFFFANELSPRSFFCIPCGLNEHCGEYDSTCPLKEVGCVIGQDNVWANIQASVDPSTMFFDLDNPNYWCPFLLPAGREKFFPNGITTIQDKDLTYTETPPGLQNELEQTLQEHVAQEFETARGKRERGKKPMRTRWRRDASDKMRPVLKALENYKFGLRTGGRGSSLMEIKRDEIRKEEEKILDGARAVSRNLNNFYRKF